MQVKWGHLLAASGIDPMEPIEIDLGTGWRLTVRVTAPGRLDVDIGRPDGLFVCATTRTDLVNGMPRLVEEPALGFRFERPGMTYPVWLVGAVVCDKNMAVIEDKNRGRFSWSKASHVWKEEVQIADNGAISVGGKTVGYIAAVFCSNKNRLVGPLGETLLPAGVAVVAPNPPKDGQIRVLEMEDLFFSTLLK